MVNIKININEDSCLILIKLLERCLISSTKQHFGQIDLRQVNSWDNKLMPDYPVSMQDVNLSN